MPVDAYIITDVDADGIRALLERMDDDSGHLDFAGATPRRSLWCVCKLMQYDTQQEYFAGMAL